MKKGAFLSVTGAANPATLKIWLRMFKDHWHWLARRWTFALLGFAAGLLCVAWLNAQAFGALWAQEEQLQSLHGQLSKLRSQVQEAQKMLAKDEAKLASNANPAFQVGLSHLPSNEHQGVIWLKFSQLLGQYDVQLRSLRPVPEVLAAPLASQAVAVRLHAKFGDWAAVWLAMNANGPVWSIDRLRITPQDQGVDIDAVLRVWFGQDRDRDRDRDQDRDRDIGPALLLEATAGGGLEPSGAINVPRVASAVFRHAAAPDFQLPVNSDALSYTQNPLHKVRGPEKPKAIDVNVNEVAEEVDTAAQAHEPRFVLAVDPAQWPLARVRLLGVWQQGQDSYAILAAGPNWVRARVGHWVAGHQVKRIHPQEVHLLPSQGTVKVLGLTKASP
jgi:Tfp pilus assembly protein PilP